MNILHIGAGKIGRGLIFPFFNIDHNIILYDSNAELVRLIKNNHGYKIIEKENDSKNIINIRNPNIKSCWSIKDKYNFDIITTSVIPKNILEIIPTIFEILSKNKRPVYIIPMENASDVKNIIKTELEKLKIDLRKIYFLGSVIDRIVPNIVNNLDIECEKYYSVIIENKNGFGKYVKETINVVDDIKKEYDKKFLLVNGMHACAAYLGYLRNHKYVYEVMKDIYVLNKLYNIGECYVQYLDNNYVYDKKQLTMYLENTIKRFSNSSIKDPLSRVGRNLLIKMSTNDRILRPYFYNQKHGLKYKPFEDVIRATKHFNIANDYNEYIKAAYKQRIKKYDCSIMNR